MTRPLGKTQAAVLAALKQHGLWHGRGYGCGWVWRSPSATRKVLDSLVARGLATKDAKTDEYRAVKSGGFL